ncbi:hypothetical protein KC358_g74 [Hortaea werneckii]|nr:hypothetical protein KC358_g74 [Hortaea werneckii]
MDHRSVATKQVQSSRRQPRRLSLASLGKREPHAISKSKKTYPDQQCLEQFSVPCFQVLGIILQKQARAISAQKSTNQFLPADDNLHEAARSLQQSRHFSHIFCRHRSKKHPWSLPPQSVTQWAWSAYYSGRKKKAGRLS